MEEITVKVHDAKKHQPPYRQRVFVQYRREASSPLNWATGHRDHTDEFGDCYVIYGISSHNRRVEKWYRIPEEEG